MKKKSLSINLDIVYNIFNTFFLWFSNISNIIIFLNLLLIKDSYKNFALTGLITCRSIKLFIDYIHNNTNEAIYIMRSGSSKPCCIPQ